MVETLVNLLVIVLAVALLIAWVNALVHTDGRCHYKTCDHCPYEGQCPEQERKAAENECN